MKIMKFTKAHLQNIIESVVSDEDSMDTVGDDTQTNDTVSTDTQTDDTVDQDPNYEENLSKEVGVDLSKFRDITEPDPNDDSTFVTIDVKTGKIMVIRLGDGKVLGVK